MPVLDNDDDDDDYYDDDCDEDYDVCFHSKGSQAQSTPEGVGGQSTLMMIIIVMLMMMMVMPRLAKFSYI